MKILSYASWILRALVFVAILAFALMNTDTVAVRFFLGQSWQLPMIVALLVFFALGALVGVLASFSRLFGQSREIARLRRELRASREAARPPAPPAET